MSCRAHLEGMPGTARVLYRDKDPRGWGEFKHQFADGSATGHARTMLGVQSRRAPLFARKTEFETSPCSSSLPSPAVL